MSLQNNQTITFPSSMSGEASFVTLSGPAGEEEEEISPPADIKEGKDEAKQQSDKVIISVFMDQALTVSFRIRMMMKSNMNVLSLTKLSEMFLFFNAT